MSCTTTRHPARYRIESDDCHTVAFLPAKSPELFAPWRFSGSAGTMPARCKYISRGTSDKGLLRRSTAELRGYNFPRQDLNLRPPRGQRSIPNLHHRLNLLKSSWRSFCLTSLCLVNPLCALWPRFSPGNLRKEFRGRSFQVPGSSGLRPRP